jgi:hypothetical protein
MEYYLLGLSYKGREIISSVLFLNAFFLFHFETMIRRMGYEASQAGRNQKRRRYHLHF